MPARLLALLALLAAAAGSARAAPACGSAAPDAAEGVLLVSLRVSRGYRFWDCLPNGSLADPAQVSAWGAARGSGSSWDGEPVWGGFEYRGGVPIWELSSAFYFGEYAVAPPPPQAPGAPLVAARGATALLQGAMPADVHYVVRSNATGGETPARCESPGADGRQAVPFSADYAFYCCPAPPPAPLPPTTFYEASLRGCPGALTPGSVEPPPGAELFTTLNVTGFRAFTCDAEGGVTDPGQYLAGGNLTAVDGSGWSGSFHYVGDIANWHGNRTAADGKKEGWLWRVNPLLPEELGAHEVIANETDLSWGIWRTDWAAGAPAPAPPIAYVVRVDTVGGATPTSCAGGGKEAVSVPFEAVYKLYTCPGAGPAPAPAPASGAAAARALGGAAAAAAWWMAA